MAKKVLANPFIPTTSYETQKGVYFGRITEYLKEKRCMDLTFLSNLLRSNFDKFEEFIDSEGSIRFIIVLDYLETAFVASIKKFNNNDLCLRTYADIWNKESQTFDNIYNLPVVEL